jgi:hypothetical protein
LFLEVDTVTVNLADLYRAASAPVAYIDESFRIDNQQSYYILACALVASEFVAETREALLAFYSGEVMHATAMNHRRELESLRKGIRLVAGKHEGMDVVVTAQIAPDDEHVAAARAACLTFNAPLIQREDGTRLFVFDRPGRAGAERQDHFTFNDLRRAGALARDTVVAHVRPSEEPNLALADLLAWAYRQEYARGVADWFEPLRMHTRIHRLS